MKNNKNQINRKRSETAQKNVEQKKEEIIQEKNIEKENRYKKGKKFR